MKRQLYGRKFNSVIDVGVGRAPYRGMIDCKKYIAVDIERRGNIDDLIIADINKKLPLDDNSADLIIMTEVLEHLHCPTLAMSEMNRILKPNGQIILTTPLLWPIHEEPNDYQRYTKYGLKKLLSDTGFKNIKITGYGNYVLSNVILLMFPLRKKIFAPFVFLLNVIGLIFIKFKFGSSIFQISNYVTAEKW